MAVLYNRCHAYRLFEMIIMMPLYVFAINPEKENTEKLRRGGNAIDVAVTQETR